MSRTALPPLAPTARPSLGRAARSGIVPLALWLAAALIAGFTAWRHLEYFDEGLFLQAASRVAAGQWPYADFGWSYGPGQPVAGALAFELLGRSVLWWRLLWVAAVASAAVLGWDLVRRAAGPRWALAAWAAVAVTLAQPATANPTPPALALALGAVAVAAAGRGPTTARGGGGRTIARVGRGSTIARGGGGRTIARVGRGSTTARGGRGRTLARPDDGPTVARAAVAAVLAALAAAWRLDFGVVAIVAVVVVFALRRPNRALLAGAVAVAATALVYLPFAVATGPARLWDALVASSAGDGAWWSLPFPWVYDGPLRSLADAKDALAYQLPLLSLAALAVAAVAIVRARRLTPAAGGLAVLATGTIAYLLSRADELHAQPLIAVAAIVAALAAASAGRRTAAVLAVLVGLIVLAGAANRGSALLRPPDLEPVHLDGVPGIRVPPAEARALPDLAATVDRLVPAGEPIYVAPRRSDLVTSTAPLVHFLVDRPNVLRRDVLLQARPDEQERIVAVLRRRRPVVIRWTDPASSRPEPNRRGRPSGSRALDEHLARAYELRARFGAFDVLVPRR